jgi:AraC-like DNA-binding protein
MVYIISGLLLIKRFDKLLENNFSETKKIDLHKCQDLLRLFFVICLVSIIIFIAGFFIPFHFVMANNLVGLAISILIYILAYMSWSRPEFKVQQLVPLSAEQNSDYTEEKSRSTLHLSDEHYQKLSSQLEKLIVDDKVYLESELSLAQLSEKLKIQPYQTSELISRQYQESFFDLINRNRIDEVKRRLHDPAFSHLSILGVALDCGFNSKSSFNTAFKKFTGQTPSQYRSTGSPTF